MQIRWLQNFYVENVFTLKYLEGGMENGNFVKLKEIIIPSKLNYMICTSQSYIKAAG